MKIIAMIALYAFLVCLLGSMPEQMKTDSSNLTKSQFSQISLNKEVREIIRPQCGSCHTSTLPTAKPGALKVFDLVRDQWLSTASTKQLGSFLSRTKNFPEEERAKIAHLIEQKKTQRASL